MRILITGGTGLIGRHAAKALCQRGHVVRVLSRRTRPQVALLAGLGTSGIEYAVGDVRDEGTLPQALEGCDAVVMSHQFPNFPVEDPARHNTFREVDELGTRNVVRAARQAGAKRLVYISGSGVGSANDKNHPGIAAKLAAERVVFESGLSAISLRISVVYAPDDKYFSLLARAARFSPLVPVFGDGASRCQPIHASDVAEVIAHAAEQENVTGVVDVGGPEVVTWKQLLLAAAEVATGAHKFALPIPSPLLNITGWLGESFSPPLFSRGAAQFLQFESVCGERNSQVVFGLQAMGLRAGLERALNNRR
jgi:NADH dehydrogenase